MKTITEMALEAGAHRSHNPELYDIWNISDKDLERFAALVIANHPPQSFMTWQEGYAAGAEAGQRTSFSKAEYTIGIDTTDGIHTVVVLRNTPGQPTTVVASQRLPEKHS